MGVDRGLGLSGILVQGDDEELMGQLVRFCDSHFTHEDSMYWSRFTASSLCLLKFGIIELQLEQNATR